MNESSAGVVRSRFSRLRHGAHVAALTLLALTTGACDDDTPSEPRDPRPEELVAAAAPAWVAGVVASLPPAALPVWDACRLAGTMQPAGTPYAIGVNCRVLRVDGVDRRFVVHVPNHPAVTSGSDVPLVVMFHGSAQNGELFYEQSSWQEEADANGWIVAFPSGVTYLLNSGTYETKWNAYGLEREIDPTWVPAGLPAGTTWPLDDIAFTTLLLDDLESEVHIDARRIHVSGFSNGGSFAGRVATEMGARVASAAAVTRPFPEAFTAAVPIPFQYLLGTRDAFAIQSINSSLLMGQPPVATVPLDPAVLFSYTDMEGRRVALAESFQLVDTVYTTSTSLTATSMVWQTPLPGNVAGNEVEWWIVRGLEHEYARGPGRRYPSNNPGGIDAPRLFRAFFATHTK
ncbi:MAG: hypothetical protein R3E10_19615 [Gemmatimonadota bacterium]